MNCLFSSLQTVFAFDYLYSTCKTRLWQHTYTNIELKKAIVNNMQ